MEKLTERISGYAHGAEGVSADRLTVNYCRGNLNLRRVLIGWQNTRT